MGVVCRVNVVRGTPYFASSTLILVKFFGMRVLFATARKNLKFQLAPRIYEKQLSNVSLGKTYLTII